MTRFVSAQKVTMLRIASNHLLCKRYSSGIPNVPHLSKCKTLHQLHSHQIQTGVPSVTSLATAVSTQNKGLREDSLVRQDVEDIYQCIREALSDTQPLLVPVAQYYFGGHGKAIRPIITLCWAKAVNYHLGKQTFPELIENQKKVCQVLEMIHAAGLYHDDVIDNAESRRSRPSINYVWGVKKSILAGDFVLGRSLRKIAEINNADVSTLLNTMIDHIVIGEIMQLSAGATEEERFAHYIDKTFKKTASLLAHSCQAVSVLSGADSNIQAMGFTLGRQLGMAFQLVDDILDFSATSAQLGKAAAVDLTQGLANAPVLFAAQQFPELNPMIARRFQEPGDVETAFQLILQSDGMKKTKELATQYCDDAVKQIAQLSSSPCQQFLFTITHKLLNRIK